MSEQPDLVLVDGSSYLFRAFHALPPLTNSRGEPTGAVVGVVNMLNRLLKDYHPRYMAVVFDAPGKTFRDDLYAEYKANRPPAPDELKAQIPLLHQVVEAMGLPLLMEEGVEADDVIGTLARRAAAQGLQVLISTGDKDMAQLVDDHITLIDTMTGRKLDRAGVEAKFGVPPERIADWLALVGDSSDNIPGVPGVGPKTAAKWLQQYGSLDAIVANADAIKGKVGEKLRASLDQLPLARELATIRTDLPLAIDLDDLTPRAPDRETLRRLFEQMEARRLLQSLAADDQPKDDPPPPDTGGDYQVILEEAQLDDWIARLEKAELFAIDTETTSLDYMQARLVGLSLAVAPGEAAYLPLAHDYQGAPRQLDQAAVLERLRPLLEDPGRPKVGQNLKYDLTILARHGVALAGLRYDTMLESYVLDATATRHDMDSLARKYLDYRTTAYHQVAGKGRNQLSFDQIPLDQAAPYAAEDADITLRLHQTLWPRLAEEPGLRRVFEEIEMPLVPVLSRMERTGVRIDTQRLRRQSQELAAELQALEEQAHQLAGHPFNLGSPKQIGQVLFDELGLEVIRKTPKGAPSTSEEVLQELAARGHELPAVILRHRSLAKLKSTYVDKLPEMVDPDTGRVHTSYHQAVAATGRLSSSDPNLQNIPVRTEEGRRIRKAFVPEPGWKMVAADYSQIELRIMAHLSGDPGLIEAFRQGLDIHAATAAEVFGYPGPDQVDPEARRRAKAINFGLIYGMSAFGLARQLGIGRDEAQDYIDLYFARYPGVRAYMERIRKQAHERGYVETLFGRRLYLPDIRARGPRRAAAERTAINAPMQGTAADIIKRAMIQIDRWIEQKKPPVRMIMQVHDELVFEIHPDGLDNATAEIRTLMENAARLDIPLLVDIGIGDDWEAAH